MLQRGNLKSSLINIFYDSVSEEIKRKKRLESFLEQEFHSSPAKSEESQTYRRE